MATSVDSAPRVAFLAMLNGITIVAQKLQVARVVAPFWPRDDVIDPPRIRFSATSADPAVTFSDEPAPLFPLLGAVKSVVRIDEFRCRMPPGRTVFGRQCRHI